MIHDWYIDPKTVIPGDGSKKAPFKTLAALDAAIKYVNNDIHRVRIKSGSTLYERIPERLSQTQVGLYMSVYGGSEAATLDLTEPCQFVQDMEHDWYKAKLGFHDWGDEPGRLTIGAVFEAGLIMPMAMYDKNHSKLRDSLDKGGYSYNWEDGWVYMVPKNPHQGYRVSKRSTILSLGSPGPFWDTNKPENDPMWNRTFEGINFKGAKRHAVEVANARAKALFRQCEFYGIGGQQWDVNSNCLGNGIECGVNASLVEVKDCWFDQIFDSGVTAQTYGHDQEVGYITFENNTFSNCGLSAIEISTQAVGNPNTVVQSITARFNRIKGNKSCFAPEIYGGRYGGIFVIYNAPGSTLTDIVIQKNIIEDQIYNALTVTGGNDVCISDNEIKRCNLGIFHGIAREQPSNVDFRQNRILDCPTGVRTNSGIEDSTITVRDNVVEGGDKSFSDGSPSEAKVVLTNNVLNSKQAIEAVRTEGITGDGNISTGTIDSRYGYLF